MPLKITPREAGEVTILGLDGKIVLGEESNLLRERVKELLNAGKKKILLNLGNISFIDSAGVGTLVSAFTSAQAQNGQLKLMNLTKKFQETLQVTRLLTVFETFTSEPEALASFK